MKRIEADTLENAYIKAANELSCSVIDLDIVIIQNPSNGILGFLKKPAIIEVSLKDKTSSEKPQKRYKKETPYVPKKEIVREISIDELIVIAKKELNELFAKSCFDLDVVKVSAYSDDTILIEFTGNDVALLIGKEGYRYKALSYMLYNWINMCYGYNVRLEIAEFLKNQEEMMEKYLQIIIEKVEINGRAQTKILDGVLIKIALESLREKFPNKYVRIKNTRDGGKYIAINDFRKT